MIIIIIFIILFSNYKVPIIAMTAYAMCGDKEKCFSVGMSDYISKPIQKSSLLNCINKWVHNKK